MGCAGGVPLSVSRGRAHRAHEDAAYTARPDGARVAYLHAQRGERCAPLGGRTRRRTPPVAKVPFDATKDEDVRRAVPWRADLWAQHTADGTHIAPGRSELAPPAYVHACIHAADVGARVRSAQRTSECEGRGGWGREDVRRCERAA
jgi:hypothetical protein